MQKRLLKEAHDQEWQSIISGDDAAIKVSRRNREIAERKVKDEKIRLSDTFGLGEDGFWNKQNKSYGKGMNHAYGNVGDGIKAEQQRKTEAANKGMNHAYENVGQGIQLGNVAYEK